ncbi:hypothetical protein C8034_v011622 [Colletotrichum sidae]|uniref:Uncharacterized protein n=1 Tax=Colletotrichum sidae TaxID=1347389 RepID=A0A4R8TID6_9PEZI|nr:hypothetical protein C8034_v011622 [Colletotrichum sidae]
MAPLQLWHFVSALSLATTVFSLEVTPGSDCAALCLGGPNGTAVDTATARTNSSDVVCDDAEYHSTGTGIKFRNCVSCLQKSEATRGADNDAAWFLYNMRYAVDVCLYDFPDAVSDINTPCIINSACLPLKNALTTSLTTADPATALDYCTADSDKFSSSSWWSCVRCLQSSESQSYLSNFLIALKAGCQQKPTDGSIVAFTGQLFSTEPINITETNTTLPGDGGASSTTMTLGTIVGISVGGGLVFIAAVCLFIVYCRKQRKQKLQLNPDTLPTHGAPPRGDDASSSYTAINKSPYIPLADHKKSSSVNSYNYELREKQQTFSSNAEYYDKLEHDVTAGRDIAHYNFDPHAGHHAAGSALPTHPAYIPRAMSRQSHRTTTTPTPPNPRKTNTPDSYALQTYLNAADDSVRPPPAVASRTPSPAHSHDSRSDRPAITPLPPPPPPPQAAQGQASNGGKSGQIPSLVLPSVPRIRVPKKYPPPRITVQGATPVADRGEGGDMYISEPLAFHEERFRDRPPAGRTAVVSHVAPPREDPVEYESEMPIRSGKSTLYG